MDNETEDRQELYDRHVRAQERLYARGRAIVWTIAVLNVLGGLLSFFTQWNVIALAVQIVLSVALVRGVSWVRYLFAVGAALSSLWMLGALLGGVSAETTVGRVWLTLLIGLYLGYSVASCVCLFASKAVSEFLYAQKNG